MNILILLEQSRFKFLYRIDDSRIPLIDAFFRINTHTEIVILDGLGVLEAVEYRLDGVVEVIATAAVIHYYMEAKGTVYELVAVDSALSLETPLILPYGIVLDDAPTSAAVRYCHIIVGLADYLPDYRLFFS